MLGQLLNPLRELRDYVHLPAAARKELRRDRQGLASADLSLDKATFEAVGWLCRAQDNSRSKDGGVSRNYSLLNGWNTSYPETTGYIIPTMLECAERLQQPMLRERARSMLDWLVSIQLPDGSFQGGVIGQTPVVGVTFNTGQILLGLAAGVEAFGETYRDAMTRAADWLVQTQDPDGCWRKHPSPFAAKGEKTYETHVAWGLFEAARVSQVERYAEAAEKNITWALEYQHPNGWFEKCCLNLPDEPLTHTLGYALRGIVEAYAYTKNSAYLEAALTTAEGLLSAIRTNDKNGVRDHGAGHNSVDHQAVNHHSVGFLPVGFLPVGFLPVGFLPGRLKSDWQGSVDWCCLTGSVQVAYCWLKLYQITEDKQLRDAAYAANRYVRQTVQVTGDENQRGGVKGSFPVNGGYGRFEYLNWACKFFIDAQLLEMDIRDAER